MHALKIGKKTVGLGRVFVIAEAGVNHNGSLERALDLVDAAAAAGADAVKFQTFKAEEVTTEAGKMADYQKRNTGKNESQVTMLRALELHDSFYEPLLKRCAQRNIVFLSTPHGGFESVDFLHRLNVPAYKFGSGDLTNLPLLVYAARHKRPLILGTGMATLDEVKEALKAIHCVGNKKVILLHCTTNYPCPLEEVDLRAMRTMQKLDAIIGYSDHTLGIQVPIMAATLGASVIEKHFTLDRTLPGPDHAASLEPQELKSMVAGVRAVETILGSPKKAPHKSEKRIMSTIRKSIVTLTSIQKGEQFTRKNLGIKRPGEGIAPKHYLRIIGTRARRTIPADTLLTNRDYGA